MDHEYLYMVHLAKKTLPNSGMPLLPKQTKQNNDHNQVIASCRQFPIYTVCRVSQGGCQRNNPLFFCWNDLSFWHNHIHVRWKNQQRKSDFQVVMLTSSFQEAFVVHKMPLQKGSSLTGDKNLRERSRMETWVLSMLLMPSFREQLLLRPPPLRLEMEHHPHTQL